MALRGRLNPAHLLCAMVAITGLQNLLLLRFLGITSLSLFAVGTSGLFVLCFFISRMAVGSSERRPSLASFAFCIAVSLCLFALGGEGRLFYANFDWQLRDAVMNDLIVNPWPFAYAARGAQELLRAPLGMYLLPALAGKAGGGMVAADFALLLQNSLFLGTLLSLASTLLDTKRARLTALLIFLAFSGMDALGWILRGGPLDPLEHLEGWAAIQYSSTFTLAAWVPQHALAGWTAGLLFLLWRRGSLPLAGFLTPLPLLALWSPLALMGAMPFAAYAFLTTAVERRLAARDLILPALATFMSFGSLLYLQAGSGSVGMRILPHEPANLFSFQMFEVVPYLAGIWMLSAANGVRRDQLIIAGACLLLFPFIQIGTSYDFMMRASIPALTILAFLVAESVVRAGGADASDRSRAWRRILIVTLAIGSLAPAAEIARAVTFKPSPYPLCSALRAADESILKRLTMTSGPADMSTYVAKFSETPLLIRPQQPFLVVKADPRKCWSRPWVTQ